MNTAFPRFAVVAYAVACALEVHAEVTMGPAFDSGMVLQRELPVPVWGTGEPGEKVTVSFAGQQLGTNADDNGQWMVKLAPLATSSTGQTMTVSGSNTIKFNRVLVDEVWLCSGQSNMAGTFTERKNRRIDPEVFDMDLSRFRFNGVQGWDTVSESRQDREHRHGHLLRLRAQPPSGKQATVWAALIALGTRQRLWPDGSHPLRSLA